MICVLKPASFFNVMAPVLLKGRSGGAGADLESCLEGKLFEREDRMSFPLGLFGRKPALGEFG